MALTRVRVVSKVAHTNRVAHRKMKRAVTFNVYQNASQCYRVRYIIVIYCRIIVFGRVGPAALTVFRFRWKLFYGLFVPIHPLISVYGLLYTHRNHVVDVVTILLKHNIHTFSSSKHPCFGNRLVIADIVCSKIAYRFSVGCQ